MGDAPFRYVHFGEIPASGLSFNHLTGEVEDGLSVYEAVENEGGEILVLLPRLSESACVSMSGVLSRKAYWVEGDVAGRGSDGEPLLANVRILGVAGVANQT